MRQRVLQGVTVAFACGLLIGLSACAGQPLGSTSATAPSASIANAGGAGWTTAPLGSQASYSSTTAPSAALQAAPRPLSTSNINTSALGEPRPNTVTDTSRPPPPPPLPGQAPLAVGTTTAPCPPDPCAPAPVVDPCDPCAPVAPAVVASGCRLPCEEGLSQWHVRAVGGIVFYEGDDPGDDCGYLGLDVGRTFCGCWGVDAFYRWNSGTFETYRPSQANPGSLVFGKDGGDWHHFGLKLTYESSFNNSRFYWWAGAGPEYFTTSDYDEDDDGFGVFGELGLGYVLNPNWRIRAGVNVHGVDTKVTRVLPSNDGKRRFLWLIAPVIEVEASF